jgi:hypothetical protein
MNPEQQAIDRRNLIKTSGIAALSAAALTPDEVAAQAPSTNTATLAIAIKEAIASATSAAPSPHDAVAGSDGAAGVGSGPLDLSPAKWLHAGVYDNSGSCAGADLRPSPFNDLASVRPSASVRP